MFNACHMSCVMCHLSRVSCVTCHVSCVTCPLSRVTWHLVVFFFSPNTLVEVKVEGLLSTGPTPSCYVTYQAVITEDVEAVALVVTVPVFPAVP